MSESSTKPTNVIQTLSNGVYPAFAMLAGMQLDVFTPLKAGPLTAVQVAEALGLDAGKLERLLYALVSAQLLVVDDGHFSNTEEAAALLVKGQKNYRGGVHELWSDIWASCMQTAATIQCAAPQARHDFEAMTDEALGAFLRGLHTGALVAGRAMAKTIAPAGRLLDVGGGSGGLAIGACASLPDLRATVAELAQVAPHTQGFIDEAGLSERVDVAVANVAQESVADKYDHAVLRNFLQTLSPEDSRRALINVGKAMPSGGRIYIVGWMLEDTRVAPEAALNFDIVFLNVYDEGRAYTVAEQGAWLHEAGFEHIQTQPAPKGLGVPGVLMITATRR